MTPGAGRRTAWAAAAVAVAAVLAGVLAAAGVFSSAAAPQAARSPQAAQSAEAATSPQAASSPSAAPPASTPAASPPLPAIPDIAAPVQGLDPYQIRAAYNLGPLAAKGIDGAGQTIVIVDSFGSPTIAKDLATFDRQFRLPAPPSLRVITPAGPVPAFTASTSRLGWAQETTLDVEWAHVMAPKASLLLVETPVAETEGTVGFPQIVAAEKYVLAHHLGQVISQSFAATEQTFGPASAIMSLRGAYTQAAADKVTVVAGSGDNGATGETYSMQSLYTSRVVAWPATDPLVTAVGGTQLSLSADGSRTAPDIAWNGSGGGVSAAFGRPSWQDGVSSVTGAGRGVPDVVMDGSCDSGVAFFGSFYPAGTSDWQRICGTSLATPLFAGVVAMADQYAGHSLGLINPALYQIAERGEPGIVDVTAGDNTQTFTQDGTSRTVTGYTAGPGYDLASGVGTINAADFVPELAAAAGGG